MRTLAVFGAGPALGLSTARRFGREGHRVALVGRNPSTLAPLAATLHADGVETIEVVADLVDRAHVRAAVDTIATTFGTPDVVLYSPGDVTRLPVDALTLDAEELETWLPLHLLSPLAVVRAVLPGMLARGSGTLLFAQGIAATRPDPGLASVGTGQAALLHYLRKLAVEVEPRGIDVHSLLISSLIERSAAAALVASGHFDALLPDAPPSVDPDVLADRLWELTGHPATLESVA